VFVISENDMTLKPRPVHESSNPSELVRLASLPSENPFEVPTKLTSAHAWEGAETGCPIGDGVGWSTGDVVGAGTGSSIGVEDGWKTGEIVGPPTKHGTITDSVTDPEPAILTSSANGDDSPL